MKVTYIGHSGFLVELERTVLLFDYASGYVEGAQAAQTAQTAQAAQAAQAAPDGLQERPVRSEPGGGLVCAGLPGLSGLHPKKGLAVFASHSHQDHFDWKVLKLAERGREIHFFFGNDIRLGNRWLAKKGIDPAVKGMISKMAGGRTAEWNGVMVRALTSTDTGVAFVAEAEGKRFYHAGDLNWWHWIGEPEEDNGAMGKAYREQIDRLAGQHFDLAFVPLDPRLEESAGWGMDYFLKRVDSDLIFPMHMWKDYGVIGRYKSGVAPELAARIVEIGAGGQEWNI